MLHIDFETRSTVDLRKRGLHVYATHPTTDVWCMAWSLDEDEVGLVTPDRFTDGKSDPLPYIRNGVTVMAHNAAFELAIWNHIMVPRYGWPKLDVRQVRCTMAMAYAMSLPGALDKAAAAVGLDMRKDLAGHRLMLQMAKPKKVHDDGTIEWWDEPEKLERLYEYCRQDVRVERELEKRLLPLSDSEQDMWCIDQRINNRGVYVDLRAVQAAIAVVEYEQRRLNDAIFDATLGRVSTCSQVAKIREWLEQQGVDVPSLAKADVTEALELPDLPKHCRHVLRLRQEAGRTSTAKLKAMVNAASEDGRVRGALQYHAAGTGRWGGRRVQPQNLPRPTIEQAEIERALKVLSC